MENFTLADPRIIITCEHGGNAIPPVWQHLFSKAYDDLAGHEGYDPGALSLARLLTEQLHAELHYTTISRLLVDCNRSLRHPKLFSKYTHRLSAREKRKILDEYYLPYRKATEEAVSRAIKQDSRVLHIAVHAFAPQMHGKVRNNDIGLLYDPARKSEKEFCVAWQQLLLKLDPKFRIRRNYPISAKQTDWPPPSEKNMVHVTTEA
jgi:predicted N-formylglutamate amidohydrolase